MKKTIIFIVCILMLIIMFFYAKYLNFKSQKEEIAEENLEYEVYLNKETYGTEIATIINRAIYNNEKNNIEKDNEGFYIENDENSIKVEIKITDNDTIYQMETLYNGGMVNFIQYYDSICFKCTDIKYNALGKVKYIFIEQITN